MDKAEQTRQDILKRLDNLESQIALLVEMLTNGKTYRISKREARPKDFKSVEEYAKSIGFFIDGQYFIDYYEARGWKYSGNIVMADWKAVVRTWKRNKMKENPGMKEGHNTSEATNDILKKFGMGA